MLFQIISINTHSTEVLFLDFELPSPFLKKFQLSFKMLAFEPEKIRDFKSHTSSVHSIRVTVIIKNGSLDNAIEQFSLALPSWYVSHNYALVYKYGKHITLLGHF